jgi:hypothetical protein
MSSQDSGSAPAYFAVITANVRYSKDIPDGAKLLFGEITALCSKEGYCWATNKYFAELYDKDNGTIRRWVYALRDAGFITIDPGKEEGNKRRIFITDAHSPMRNNAPSPLRNNAHHNNTSGIIQEEQEVAGGDVASVSLAEKGKRYFRDFTEQLVRYGQKEPSARAALAKLKNTYGDTLVFTTYFDNAALLETKEGGAFEYFVGILKRLKADAEEVAVTRQQEKTKAEKFNDMVLEQSAFYKRFTRPTQNPDGSVSVKI